MRMYPRFGPPIVPWFMPLLVPDAEGLCYLAEDYAFCERARLSGLHIMADTRIRLYHVGSHGYSREDPGHEIPQWRSVTLTTSSRRRPPGRPPIVPRKHHPFPGW